MERILITGGSGFIGGHFQNVLEQTSLINLDLCHPSSDRKATFVQGDIRKLEDVEKVFQNYEVKTIISLAAKHHDFGIGHDEYFDTNEEGTAVICKVATKYNVEKIVFFSSVAVYGVHDQISTEESEPKPDSPYGASKLAGESVLKRWALEKADRKVLILRPTVVFGPGNMANMRSLIRQIDSGFYFHLGKADNIKSIAYVENIVKATLFLMNRMQNGVSIYNYSDEPQLTTRVIGSTIAKNLRTKIRFTLPLTLGILIGFLFDLLIKVTGKNLPVSSARIKKLATSTHHSATKIFSEGFIPDYSTIQGLAKMVEWYQSEKQH